ncbi:class I SAM-dependent methyltransferase [Streptomyces sp. NPDC002490]|uniref:class I SAM-dependent methyltransferase n=1 Tax=Streptomyces sp. NPDC002490 TaxID=3154416 RepID=UPI0033199DAC
MDEGRAHETAWQGFWSEAPGEAGGVFWDADPATTVAVHLTLFESHFIGGLPLVDIGCGNGTQTRYLARRFPRVVGTDLAPAAVAHARRADPAGTVDFRTADMADPATAGQLHDELGDAHVYMRGVLHQCPPEERQPLVDGIATLLGARGRGFLVEPAEAAGALLRGLAAAPTGPPAKLAPVLAHGIAPGEVPDASVPVHVRAAGLGILARGDLPLTTTETTEAGPIVLPSRWLLVTARER